MILKNQIISGSNKIVKFEKNIELKNVFFDYENVKGKVLENLSLNIQKNKITGIYGVSGSGKSTITDLILRLIDPKREKY